MATNTASGPLGNRRRQADRRNGLGRRIIRQRRRQQLPVAVERRSTAERRSWMSRRSGVDRRRVGLRHLMEQPRI